MEIVSVFKGLTSRLRTVSSGRRGCVTFGIVVRIFTFLLWPCYKGGLERVAWPRWVYLIRCGAHLSNLALDSSGEAQSLVGRNMVQVASWFEIFRAISSRPDMVSALTGHVRSILAVTAKIITIDRTWFSHGPDAEIVLTRVREDKCCDRTWLGTWPNASTVHSVHFQRGTSLTRRIRSSPIRLIRASGQSTEMFLSDWTRPVTPDRTHCASSHSALLVSNSTVATNRTRLVTSTGAFGQYIKCWVGT
jgi:hypothetical protein